MNLPVKTITDIRDLPPCYDPAKYAPEDWQGTALDVLKAAEVPAQDRIWLVCHEGWIDDRTLRLFTVWCARQMLAMVDDPDPRSVAACDVAERYANGQATETELEAALSAARDAAWAAARTVSRLAECTAALDVQVAHLIGMLER